MIKEKLHLVPNLPGCYQMKNKDGVIIYVGKAKKLKNRLSSYFRGKHTGKTAKLVSEIADFDYVVVVLQVVEELFAFEISPCLFGKRLFWHFVNVSIQLC